MSDSPPTSEPADIGNETLIQSTEFHLLGLGAGWTMVGKGLLGLGLLSTVLLIVHLPFSSTWGLRKDPLSILAMFMWITIPIACTFWMTVDLIDRRQRFLWLMPIFVCGLSDLVFLPLALYLHVSRKLS